jgi:hypothetical protein
VVEHFDAAVEGTGDARLGDGAVVLVHAVDLLRLDDFIPMDVRQQKGRDGVVLPPGRLLIGPLRRVDRGVGDALVEAEPHHHLIDFGLCMAQPIPELPVLAFETGVLGGGHCRDFTGTRLQPLHLGGTQTARECLPRESECAGGFGDVLSAGVVGVQGQTEIVFRDCAHSMPSFRSGTSAATRAALLTMAMLPSGWRTMRAPFVSIPSALSCSRICRRCHFGNVLGFKRSSCPVAVRR